MLQQQSGFVDYHQPIATLITIPALLVGGHGLIGGFCRELPRSDSVHIEPVPTALAARRWRKPDGRLTTTAAAHGRRAGLNPILGPADASQRGGPAGGRTVRRA
ncbi:MAG TPA: hypothetical protein VGH89_14670 [Pseudonocardia sp.]